VNFERNFVNV